MRVHLKNRNPSIQHRITTQAGTYHHLGGFMPGKKAGQKKERECNHPELIFPAMNRDLADQEIKVKVSAILLPALQPSNTGFTYLHTPLVKRGMETSIFQQHKNRGRKHGAIFFFLIGSFHKISLRKDDPKAKSKLALGE